jgi:hypothetical protein
MKEKESGDKKKEEKKDYKPEWAKKTDAALNEILKYVGIGMVGVATLAVLL